MTKERQIPDRKGKSSAFRHKRNSADGFPGTFTRPADALLAAEVELNNAAMLRLRGRLPGVELHDDKDVIWLFAGDLWPRNSVALSRLTPRTADRRIGEILERHLASKVACNWVVGPLSKPAGLTGHLRSHGFSCRIHCAGMACMLENNPPVRRCPDDISIALAKEPPVLRPLTTELRQMRYRGRSLLGGMRPHQVWYLAATSNGKAVGETALFSADGVAGIYDVEVLEDFRRRGIGTALIRAALEQAQALGCAQAVLGASGMGRGVYQGLGFREVCKLSFWKYGKMRQLTASD